MRHTEGKHNLCQVLINGPPALPQEGPQLPPFASSLGDPTPVLRPTEATGTTGILENGQPRLPSILVTNPQSLTNCFDEFVEVVNQNQPDVVVVSETWFSETRPASQFQVNGYRMFNDDREGRGGGVAVYARESLDPYEVHLKSPPELECVWVEVSNRLVVCGLYHPPHAPTGPLLMDQIVNSVLDIRAHNPALAVAVAGDFNNLHQGRLCSSLGLTNLVLEPTHMNSIIDLVLTDQPEGYHKPVLLPPIGRSRHSCVLVKPKTPTVLNSHMMVLY